MKRRSMALVGVLLSSILVGSMSGPAMAAPSRAAVGTPASAAPGTYQESSPVVSLTGTGWQRVSHSRDSGGGSAYTMTAGSAVLDFEGTAIAVVGRKTPSAGVASILVDGAEVARVDLYAAAAQYQVVLWSSASLEPGSHRVEMQWTGEKNPLVSATNPSMVIDRFVVFDSGEATMPRDVQVDAIGSSVAVSWQPASGYRADAFGVLRRSGGEWASIGTVAGDEVGFSDAEVLAGSTYEYAVLARDDIGNESQPAQSVPVTVGQAAGVGVYQENSPNVLLRGSWVRTSHSRDLGGASSYLTSSGSASLRFTGPAVSVIGRKTPSSGFVNVIVDGRRVATIDRYAPTTLYQQELWSATDLGAGDHTIEVQWTSQRNAAVSTSAPSLSLDAFVVPESVAAVGVGTYEEDSPQLAFSGAWTRTAHSADSGQASSYATADASVSVSFSGTSVRWISRTGPKSGIADVYIDGSRVARVDRYSASNQYQQVVWETSSLSAGTHRLEIRWTPDRNAASTGNSLVLDAIVVPPAQAPSPPTSVVAEPFESGARITWQRSGSADPATYRVYRLTGADAAVKVAELPGTQTQYVDPGLPIDQSFRYAVTAIDTFGLESARGISATVTGTAGVPTNIPRAADCPAATVTVRTATQLKAALAEAAPGASIWLAPGTYEGSFRIDASGTSTRPIWICGTASAVISPNTLVRGTGLYISGSDVVVAGMSISRSLKGVMVVGGHRVTLADMTISDIGDEAVHFRNSSTDGALIGSTIARTGLTNPGFGEGVYIGTSSANWCAYNDCAVDRSNGVSVVSNVIRGATAEAIEVKEGVSGATIYGNTISTTGAPPAGVESALQIKGNDNVVMANNVTTDRAYGFRVMFTAQDWGFRNVLAGNSVTLRAGAAGMVYLAKSDNVVKCDNTVSPQQVPLGVTCVP